MAALFSSREEPRLNVFACGYARSAPFARLPWGRQSAQVPNSHVFTTIFTFIHFPVDRYWLKLYTLESMVRQKSKTEMLKAEIKSRKLKWGKLKWNSARSAEMSFLLSAFQISAFSELRIIKVN